MKWKERKREKELKGGVQHITRTLLSSACLVVESTALHRLNALRTGRLVSLKDGPKSLGHQECLPQSNHLDNPNPCSLRNNCNYRLQSETRRRGMRWSRYLSLRALAPCGLTKAMKMPTWSAHVSVNGRGTGVSDHRFREDADDAVPGRGSC